MAIVVGVDEAGFGPLLGPLVVSAAAFQVPDEVAGDSLWRLLSAAVSRRRPRDRRRIAVADSKRLYAGLRGDSLGELERGVLAMLASRGLHPRSLTGLLRLLHPETLRRLHGYPWYAGADLSLPRAGEPEGTRDPRPRLRRSLERSGVRLHCLASEVVLAREFNRGLRESNNKAVVLLAAARRLLTRVWSSLPGGPVAIHVDRMGGRRRYAAELPPMVEGTTLTPLAEERRCSSYRILGPGREATLTFTVAAEDRQLPVALASMTSKYLRELFMTLLNQFWSRVLPDLRPTAGYYGDGRRFFREIRPVLLRSGWEPSLVFRRR